MYQDKKVERGALTFHSLAQHRPGVHCKSVDANEVLGFLKDEQSGHSAMPMAQIRRAAGRHMDCGWHRHRLRVPVRGLCWIRTALTAASTPDALAGKRGR
jgi:hypothetical protein